MTKALNQVALANLTNITLAQLLPTDTTTGQLPCAVALSQDHFFIENTVTLTQTSEPVTNSDFSHGSDGSLELVTFSDITIDQLVKIAQNCQLTLNSLTAINVRNNATSYRFNVAAENLPYARQQLVAINLSEKIESVLISNAPLLTTPGVLLMDMDSTAIKIECIDELATLAGVGEQVAEVTELAMQGKLDFSQSLHQRVGTLAGAPVSILDSVLATLPLMEGLETLVKSLQQYQWRVAIASGGFTYFADHLKTTLSLDSAVANTLEIVDEKLTGKVLGDVIDAQAKADNLLSLANEYSIADTQTVAMGDGANDLVMMNAAALGVAFHAKQLVVDKADVGINHQGLDCLLHWLK